MTAAALAASALVHVALLGVAAWSASSARPRRLVAVDVIGVSATTTARPVPAQPAPLPPTPSPPSPAPPTTAQVPPTPQRPAPAPKPRPVRAPRPVRPSPSPATPSPPPAQPNDAVALAPSDADAPPPDFSEPTAAPGADGTAPWPPDQTTYAGAASGAITESAPPGAATWVVRLRLDRLRGTPWARAFERLVMPLPDYRAIVTSAPGPDATPVVDGYDALLIATPDPRDVTATFLAARHTRTEDDLHAALGSGEAPPRVRWSRTAGGELGERSAGARTTHRDRRVFFVPGAGLVLLARPEQLGALVDPKSPGSTPGDASPSPQPADPGAPSPAPSPGSPAASPEPGAPPSPTPPTWLVHVQDDLAPLPLTTPSPVVAVAIGDLGTTLGLPGLPPMPAPKSSVLSAFLDEGGIAVIGVLDFADAAAAERFRVAATTARDTALASFATRFVLEKLGAQGALAALAMTTRGAQVALTTRLDAADAAVLLTALAAWTETYFREMTAESGPSSPPAK
jgi:hypothetical protein